MYSSLQLKEFRPRSCRIFARLQKRRTAMSVGEGPASSPFENVDDKEAEQIASVVAATEKQLQNRYAKTPPFLRGVHPKAHGCVTATFTVLEDLPPDYRVGVFATPGQKFKADIRFSNAAPLVTGD